MSVWAISISLCAVSVDGVVGLPNIVSSLQTFMQYLVAASHIAYIITGIIIVIGIWRSLRSTRVVVIIWGITSLGAALGGPLAFAPTSAMLARTTIVITITILLASCGLLWYVHNMIRSGI